MPSLNGERGSALVEAAILFPVLVLLLHWSIALTDVSLLRLAASEATRFALWETVVWKDPEQIGLEVAQRFSDLRSPALMRGSTTDLLLFPDARALRWQTSIASGRAEPDLPGAPPPASLPGQLAGFVGAAAASMPGSPAGAVRALGFGASGATVVRLRLEADSQGSSILAGGDLPTHPGGSDFSRPASLAGLGLTVPLPSERPMRLVFDTWKAWPTPVRRLDGAVADAAFPNRTYPVVERQISARVGRIAFSGIRQRPWFSKLDAVDRSIGVSPALLGGRLPRIFATGRLDDAADPGPISVLPPGAPDAPFVPNACAGPAGSDGRCANARIGDVLASSPANALAGPEAFTPGEDSPRSTVPFRVHGRYWTKTGGTAGRLGPSVHPYPARIARENGYVVSWGCRGHFFAGSYRPEEADVRKRYRPTCR